MHSAEWMAAKDREIARNAATKAAAKQAVSRLSSKDRKKAQALAKKALAKKGRRLLSTALSARDVLAAHQHHAKGKTKTKKGAKNRAKKTKKGAKNRAKQRK